MRALQRIALALAGFCLFVCMLSGIVHSRVTSAAMLLSGFNQFADTSLMGVPASAYPDYAAVIADYMTGRRADLRVTAADGTERPGFSEKECLHMADVRGLVRGLNAARFVSGGLALLIIGAYWLRRRSGAREATLRALLRGMAAGACALVCLALAAVIWGLCDFDSLFVAFHRLVFSNQLWLLNPREHLLIMLMPTPFFTWYAGQLLLSCAPVLALALALMVGTAKIARKDRKKRNDPK